ncbi:MAG: hypothetical protein ACLGG0_05510 [Bacteriovoracia bacterium]
MQMDLIDFSKLKSRLDHQGEIQLNVASDSMHPVLKVGQLITVKPSPSSSLCKFDIIVFWGQGKLMSHFLWAKQWDERDKNFVFITKSLKEPTSHDLPIKENLILGIVDSKISTFSKICIWLRNI